MREEVYNAYNVYALLALFIVAEVEFYSFFKVKAHFYWAFAGTKHENTINN